MECRSFGKNSRDKETTLYTFTNKRGMMMGVTDFGATLHAVLVPDKEGNLRDVVLGYDDALGYENAGGTFAGAAVGRNANRIGQASFVLNEKTYVLDKNDGDNNLHGGSDCYGFRVWDVKNVTENSITFSLHSPDGDQGFPGALDMNVTYTLTDDDEVKIDYYTIPDADTIINMTNHSYFNLDGDDAGSVLEQEVWLDADAFTRADAQSIPTGEIIPVEGTPMDFRVKKAIGRDIAENYEALNFGHGYDHNWVLNNKGKFAKVAEMSSAVSGITMEVYTDLPGVQIYTGNFIEHEPGKHDVVYEKHQGICFETQYFPDAVHHENFASPICKANEEYKTTTIYKFLM